MTYHNPVLLKESLAGLNIQPQGTYADVTYGGGGHSKEILSNLTTGRLFGFDQDSDALVNKAEHPQLTFVKQNFRHMKKYLKFYDVLPIDGILADLGVSSHQFDNAERGFSTRFDAGLDMRMDQNSKLTAKVILNTYTIGKLQELFSQYGEIINSKTLANTIVTARNASPIETIKALKEAIAPCVNKANANQYYAQVFQALRIEVNDELGALKDLLVQSAEVLKKGGRLVVISYHSLEDRLVKNFIAKGKFEGELEKDVFGNFISEIPFKAILKKPLVPTEKEIKENSRARSAKLRVAERV
jgi:16S rRNA (cytosine1402-N4)-methyltransferase